MRHATYTADQLNLLGPDELAALSLGGSIPTHKREKFDAAGRPLAGSSRVDLAATPPGIPATAAAGMSPHDLAVAALSGHAPDFHGNLVQRAGAGLGQVK